MIYQYDDSAPSEQDTDTNDSTLQCLGRDRVPFPEDVLGVVLSFQLAQAFVVFSEDVA